MKKLKKMLCLGLCMLLTAGTLLAAQPAQAASAFSFKYKGVTATPGKSAKKLCKKAGKVKKYSKTSKCAKKGYWIKTYKFKDFTIYTYSNSSKKNKPGTLMEIKLTSSKVKTREGIRIGSSEKSLIQKYGKGESYKSGSTTSYYYEKGSTSLEICVKNGKVKSIYSNYEGEID